MRAESDLQGHHRSGAPGCHRCGLPLMVDATYCPYCERWLEESPLRRLLGGRRAARGAGARERLLLVAGLAVFGLIAAACIVAAVLVA
ncbi:MAG: hypothetical protein AB1416_13240 [Actinomycetota bacterium]